MSHSGSNTRTANGPHRFGAAWVWIALFAGAGALAVAAGNWVYEPANAALCLAVGVSVTVSGRLRGRADSANITGPGQRRQLMRRLVLGAITGALLGVLLFVACTQAWGANEVVLGGRTGPLPQYCLAVAFGTCVGLIVLRLGRTSATQWRERLRIGAIAAMLLAATMGAVLYFALTGPTDLDQYPPADTSPYKLPWKAGVRRLCSQSNRGIVTHRGWDQFAYDFAMAVGTDICAARAGTIVDLAVEHDGNGYGAPANFIIIDHGDGTAACYAHIKLHGSYVAVGQHVQQGEPIAASGNVGHSLAPHLHFHVTNGHGRTVPITFADVPGDGIPRMGWRYTSGNTGSP